MSKQKPDKRGQRRDAHTCSWSSVVMHFSSERLQGFRRSWGEKQVPAQLFRTLAEVDVQRISFSEWPNSQKSSSQWPWDQLLKKEKPESPSKDMRHVFHHHVPLALMEVTQVSRTIPVNSWSCEKVTLECCNAHGCDVHWHKTAFTILLPQQVRRKNFDSWVTVKSFGPSTASCLATPPVVGLFIFFSFLFYSCWFVVQWGRSYCSVSVHCYPHQFALHLEPPSPHTTTTTTHTYITLLPQLHKMFSAHRFVLLSATCGLLSSAAGGAAVSPELTSQNIKRKTFLSLFHLWMPDFPAAVAALILLRCLSRSPSLLSSLRRPAQSLLEGFSSESKHQPSMCVRRCRERNFRAIDEK